VSGQDFDWDVETLLKTGSIKPENIAVENMTESTITTTEIPQDKRVKLLQEAGVPYFGVCTNDTKVILDPKKIYGYYRREISVQNPVSDVVVSNNVWLKHGDMCQLYIKFNGSPPFHVCEKYSDSENTTEIDAKKVTCEDKDWKQIDEKEIAYYHLFSKDHNVYTVTVFIKNEVSLKETPIGVQFYEGKENVYLNVTIY
jgi:hypothetical protein